jgi:hypothetical protein
MGVHKSRNTPPESMNDPAQDRLISSHRFKPARVMFMVVER